MIKSSCTRSKCLPEVPCRCTIDNENYLAQRLKLVDLLSMKTFLLSCMLVPKFKKMWKKRGEPDHWTMGQLSNQSISSISGMRAPLKNGSRELRHFSCHGRPIIRTSSPRIRCQFRRRFSYLRQRGRFIWKKNQKPGLLFIKFKKPYDRKKKTVPNALNSYFPRHLHRQVTIHKTKIKRTKWVERAQNN